MLPQGRHCPEEEIRKVIIAWSLWWLHKWYDECCKYRNVADMGAKLALLSIGKLAKAQATASRVSCIELATAPYFAKICVQATYFRIIGEGLMNGNQANKCNKGSNYQ